jgi:hypothetical protein
MNGTGKSEPRILSSWKDIARYTGRGVRTLQRYELRFGFPVHRLNSRGAVMAFVHEIDAWLKQAPLHPRLALKDGACPLCFGTGVVSRPQTGGTKRSLQEATAETPTPAITRTG